MNNKQYVDYYLQRMSNCDQRKLNRDDYNYILSKMKLI